MITAGFLARLLGWAAGVTGAGWLSAWLGIPVPWFLGPLFASMLLQQWLPLAVDAQKKCSRVGQVTVALVVGTSFTLSGLSAGAEHALPLLLLLLITMGLSVGNAFLLRRWAKIDGSSAFLGSLPGGAGPILALISDLKVDRQLITLLMYTRILLILTVLPLVLAHWFVPADGLVPESVAMAAKTSWTPILLLPGLTVGLAGGWVAARWSVPSAWFLGPFLATAVFHAISPALFPGFPRVFLSAGLLLLAVSIGLQFDPRRVVVLWRVALVQSVLALILIAGCLIAGLIFHLYTGVDIVTAVLGSAPGGKEALVALGVTLGANVELLVIMQTVRWLAITILVPFILRRIILKEI